MTFKWATPPTHPAVPSRYRFSYQNGVFWISLHNISFALHFAFSLHNESRLQRGYLTGPWPHGWAKFHAPKGDALTSSKEYPCYYHCWFFCKECVVFFRAPPLAVTLLIDSSGLDLIYLKREGFLGLTLTIGPRILGMEGPSFVSCVGEGPTPLKPLPPQPPRNLQ